MKYIIIGGNPAGMSAAMQIVRNDENAEITTLEKDNIYSYAQCGLPYAVSGVVSATDHLIARSVETFRDKFGIDARTQHKVENINPNKKQVHGTNLQSGDSFTLAYDKLLIATGASPIMPSIEGNDLQGVHLLKTIPDAQNIMQGIEKTQINNVVIVGGGYIGLEAAEAFKKLDKHVTMIDHGSHVAKIFDKDMATLIHEEAEKHGIDIHTNEKVTKLIGKTSVEKVETNQGTYNADLVLLAVGINPNTELIQGTEIHTGIKGAIQVNPYMETNIQDIYAAGDCAEQYHFVKKKNDYVPLGTTANKQGRIAGLNMVHKPRTFKGVAGTSIIQFMDLSLGRTGMSEKEVESLHIPYDTVYIKSLDRAGYYPGKEVLHVKLVYHRYNKQLLGGQIIGRSGVDKRVDVLATALYHEMTLQELEDLDLGYAPPYNGVWDPIQQAARRG